MATWTRDELQRAHDHYLATAQEAGRTNDWRAWADLFTEDATYVEHHYGTMEGREAIFDWISKTMAEWPNSEMKEFPHDWCVCDEERGWWICQIENRFRDPGDGEIYQAYNLTVLKYAGNMRFSSEEDAYNPANFAPVVKQWIAASRRAEAVLKGVRAGIVGCLILATTAACGSSKDPRDRPPIFRELPTVPPADTPANPASSSPCVTLGTADMRSAFGGGVGTGVIDPNNTGSCTWIVVADGAARKFTFSYPGPATNPQIRTPNAVAVTKAEMAKTAGARVVPGVGDFAYFDPATATLHVAKAPNIAFSVRLTKGTGEPITDTAALDQLKVLANKFIATR